MANTADISFVHLGITIDHLQNSISIFGFRIAFYGIIIGIGILAGLWVATSDAKRRDRTGYLSGFCSVWNYLFYYRSSYLLCHFDWENYRDNLISIFKLLRAGGLAIYGGVIAAVITCLYKERKALSFQ